MSSNYECKAVLLGKTRSSRSLLSKLGCGCTHGQLGPARSVSTGVSVEALAPADAEVEGRGRARRGPGAAFGESCLLGGSPEPDDRPEASGPTAAAAATVAPCAPECRLDGSRGASRPLLSPSRRPSLWVARRCCRLWDRSARRYRPPLGDLGLPRKKESPGSLILSVPLRRAPETT